MQQRSASSIPSFPSLCELYTMHACIVKLVLHSSIPPSLHPPTQPHSRPPHMLASNQSIHSASSSVQTASNPPIHSSLTTSHIHSTCKFTSVIYSHLAKSGLQFLYLVGHPSTSQADLTGGIQFRFWFKRKSARRKRRIGNYSTS